MYPFINERELMKIVPVLNEYKSWLPLVLLDYINPIAYFNRVDDDVITDFYNRKHDFLLVDNKLQLLEYDLREWIKENPKYENILISSFKLDDEQG